MATCGEVLVQILEAYGIDTVFGIPGVHTVELYRGLPGTRIRHVTPRHEQGAGFMADGYARVSGRPAVCFIITGPGMTNIATAMGQALADSVPMLVISSVNRTHQLGMGEGRLHELPDQGALVSGVSVFSHTLMRPDELPKVLARAFAVFASERPGPVHIEIPIDVITQPADHVDHGPWPLPSAPGPAPEAILTAARWLASARSPLVLLGGGAVGARAELQALAEHLQIPVLNTVNAKGLLPASHPLSVGGSGSCPSAREALQGADVVLAIGTEFGETDYSFYVEGDVSLGGRLIRIDIDAAQLTRNVKPSLAIRADARLATRALLDAVTELSPSPRAADGRAAALRAGVQRDRNPDFHAFFRTIRDALPEAVIAGDSTQPTYYACLYYETEHPRRYFHSASGFGTLGYAIPAALGAKLAAPRLPVIALIGDGASQYTIAELAAAVEAGLAIIVVVWNNRGYAEIKRYMQARGIPAIGVDIYTPDFITIAQGFGCHAERVTDLDTFGARLRAASERPGPSLIEVAEADFLSS